MQIRQRFAAGAPLLRGRDAPPAWRSRSRLLPALLLAAAGLLAAQALWIPAKAALAQQLLEQAWQRSLTSAQPQRPWPWADTAPVARLLRLSTGESQIVLAGDSGRTLAFGPGWNEASAAPLSGGTALISAHRDTHFAWLRDIADSEEVELQSTQGQRRYRLHSRRIVDVRQQGWVARPDRDALLLVTCWPFDAVDARGPLRLLLEFEAVAATDQGRG